MATLNTALRHRNVTVFILRWHDRTTSAVTGYRPRRFSCPHSICGADAARLRLLPGRAASRRLVSRLALRPRNFPHRSDSPQGCLRPARLTLLTLDIGLRWLPPHLAIPLLSPRQCLCHPLWPRNYFVSMLYTIAHTTKYASGYQTANFCSTHGWFSWKTCLSNVFQSKLVLRTRTRDAVVASCLREQMYEW